MNETQNSVPPEDYIEPKNVLKWIFSRNPFYLFSAGLLLYAIYRLSIDPKMFASELGQLLFNFGSFQVYELLLVGTAIFLVRRKIWYDSGLLVALENFLVLVPFILISQALLIEGDIAATLCVGATALTVCRFAGIKKYFRKINFPTRLLLMGGVLLGVNVGLPLLVKMLHTGANTDVWSVKGSEFYRAAWLICIPLLLAVVNLLPRPKVQGELLVEKSYFPLVIFTVWLLVTGVHLYSIGYVYALKWNHTFILPVIWLAAWTLWNRFYDFDILDEETEADLHQVLLVPTLIIPLFAAFTGEWTLFLVMVVVNAAVYAFLTMRDRSRMAFHLLMLSGAMIMAGLPRSVFEMLHINLSRGQAFGMGVAAYILIRAMLSRSPKMGMLGGLVSSICVGILFRRADYSMHVALHLGALFVLLHSLRWIDREHAGASSVRNVVALCWVLQSFFWLARDGQTALAATASFSIVTLVVYFAVKLIFGSWGPRIVPLAAGMILLCKPVLLCFEFTREAPTGVLALVGSFLLFAFGTVAALARNRSNKNERPLSSATPITDTTL